MRKDGILRGDEAKKICHEILENETISGSFNVSYPKHIGARGYFPESGVITAFDNSDGNCWVESFDTTRKAIKWIKGDY